jgi:hypothetical protein
VKPKLLIVLAAIIAPSCVALCSICIADGFIYKRRKRQDQEQRQQQRSGVAASNGDSNAQLASRARRRLPSGPGAGIGTDNNLEKEGTTLTSSSSSSKGLANSSKTNKKNAKRSGEMAPAQPGPPTLDHSNSAGYEFEQDGHYNSHNNNNSDNIRDHPEVTASRIEFLDPFELQRATNSSDGGSGLRHARCRDSIDLTSAPEPGGHPHHHHHHNRRGAFGSLAGSVAGMASNVAAAIGNRLRSSQAGAAYKVPGLEPAGLGPNRGLGLGLGLSSASRGPYTFKCQQGTLHFQVPAGGPTLSSASRGPYTFKCQQGALHFQVPAGEPTLSSASRGPHTAWC